MAKIETVAKDYFTRMAEIRGTPSTTKEESYKGALEKLFIAIGRMGRLKVKCIPEPQKRRSGRPDYAFFSVSQRRRSSGEWKVNEIPEHGVVEAKSPSEDVVEVSMGEQTRGYLNDYGLVLVTNHRAYVLVQLDGSGNVREVDKFVIAESEAEFWTQLEKPKAMAIRYGDGLVAFLRRVMMHSAKLKEPEDVAWFLASYAQDAMKSLELNDQQVLSLFKEAMENVLEIKFNADQGQHFFNSTVVQTLIYGIFSAWVNWCRRGEAGKFDWVRAATDIRIPAVRDLFAEVAKTTNVEDLGLGSMLEETSAMLNRIQRDEFFDKFSKIDAVQHFYEPFLKAFDPESRKKLGVWYTPKEIVKYMVERIDRTLRSELGVERGLADKRVYVLDPCCGTGAYIIEVMRRIEKTLKNENDDDAIGDDLKEAVKNRIYGFEIIPAPFVIAHWQVANYLASRKAPLNHDEDERASIYLTNALTGWFVPKKRQKMDHLRGLEMDMAMAEKVKRDTDILVVLGNPPYDAFAGVNSDEEVNLTKEYCDDLYEKFKIKRCGANDLYAKFIRIAERRIEWTGKGIVSYISNSSWTDDPSYACMREHMLKTFDKFWIENMHGDRNARERAPDGKSSQTVFHMKGVGSGIRQKVAVFLGVKHENEDRGGGGRLATVLYRDNLNASNAEKRRKSLLESLDDLNFDDRYEVSSPEARSYYSLLPGGASPDYATWPGIEQIGEIGGMDGLLEKRGGALIDFDKGELERRMRRYLDSGVSREQLYREEPKLERLIDIEKPPAAHDPVLAMETVRQREPFSADSLVKYAVRPFDRRYAYWTNASTIWNSARPTLWEQHIRGNRFIISRPKGVNEGDGPPIYFTRCLPDNHVVARLGKVFPLKHYHGRKDSMFDDADLPARTNLSSASKAYLDHLGFSNLESDHIVGALPWMHMLAVAYSPKYLKDNALGIVRGWPRFPFPDDRALLEQSSALGDSVAELLDMGADDSKAKDPEIVRNMKGIGRLSGTDRRVAANWDKVMVRQGGQRIGFGKGDIRPSKWTNTAKESLKATFARLGLDDQQGFEILGAPVDVHLNDETCWSCVPERVVSKNSAHDYCIGGQNIIRKWLAHRESRHLGRGLSPKEARWMTSTIRRTSVLILMRETLDANYRACCDSAYDWPADEF